jgi:hypothetical protein
MEPKWLIDINYFLPIFAECCALATATNKGKSKVCAAVGEQVVLLTSSWGDTREKTSTDCGWGAGHRPIGSRQRGGYGSASLHEGASDGRRYL